MPFTSLAKVTRILLAFAISFLLYSPSAKALSISDFPSTRPQGHVYDGASLLSISATSELEKRLTTLGDNKIDARLITLRGLDYGVSLPSLGDSLISRWSDQEDNSRLPLLLFMIESQNNQSAVQVDQSLTSQLPPELLRSIGKTTMSQPLRQSQQYRKASVDAIDRLEVVFNGGEDPGPPAEIVQLSPRPLTVPSKEETQGGNAATLVAALLIIGTLVPMGTWWFFSR